MRGKAIACENRGRDRYGRSIGLCRANGEDLGAAMVSAGMAWAFARYSSDYVDQERAALGARLGVHSHDCEKAWDWRAMPRLPTTNATQPLKLEPDCRVRRCCHGRPPDGELAGYRER
jgi:endonuclease YncB( thermonuclease family)